MTISMRKAGLIAGAAVLMSAASSSAAFAANPITVSYASGLLTIDDPTGVAQADYITSVGSGLYEITESYTANEFSLGTGAYVAVNYGTRDWVVGPSSGTITRILVRGRDGNDVIDASAVNDVPVSLYGEGGNDWLVGSSVGGDVLVGGDGADYEYGGDGNDDINGGNGSDHLYGQNGDDTLSDADSSIDTVDGGAGTDDFTGDTFDVVTNVETRH